VDYLEQIRPQPTAYPDDLRDVCQILGAWERVYGSFEAIRRNPKPVWERLHPSLRRLEECLRSRDYLMADAPSAFDFAIYSDFHALAVAQVPNSARHPRLRSWFRRVDRL
jgi:glutathione S-transferase